MRFRLSTYLIVLFLALVSNLGMAHDEVVKKPYPTSYHHFTVLSNLIVVQAEMNGKVGNYIFDTGATGLVLNADYHKTGNATTSIQGVAKTVSTVHKMDILEFRFGNIVKENFTVSCLSLGHIESMINVELAGLIGAQLITLMDRSMIIDQPDHVMDIRFINNVPTIAVAIGNEKARMAIDFGASTSLLNESIAANLDLTIIEQVNLQTASGMVDRMDKVQIDEMKLDDSFSYDTQAVVVDLSHLKEII